MALILCLRWWYGAGWRWVWQRMIIDRFVRTGEMFSMRALTNTLFAPFRQTFTGPVRGGLDAHIRAFVDNIISRVIGTLVRSLLLLTGSLVCIGVFLFGLCILALWAFIPISPAVAIVLTAIGLAL